MTLDIPRASDATGNPPTAAETADAPVQFAALAIHDGLGITAYGPYPSMMTAADSSALIGSGEGILGATFLMLTTPWPTEPTTMLTVDEKGITVIPPDLVDALDPDPDEETPHNQPTADTGLAAVWVITASRPHYGVLFGPFPSAAEASTWITTAEAIGLHRERWTIRVLLLNVPPDEGPGHAAHATDPADVGYAPTEGNDAGLPGVLVLHSGIDKGNVEGLLALGPFPTPQDAKDHWDDIAATDLHAAYLGPLYSPADPGLEPQTRTTGGSTEASTTIPIVTNDVRILILGAGGPASGYVVLVSSHGRIGATRAMGGFDDMNDVLTWSSRWAFAPQTTLVVLPLRHP